MDLRANGQTATKGVRGAKKEGQGSSDYRKLKLKERGN